MKARFIFNPRSGHNQRNPYLLDRALSFIGEHKINASVIPTEKPRHATELTKRAIDDGCEMVIAIGGDGTMNEVASALVGTDVALGLIPCGSGNGLGRHLGIPGPGRGAFRTLLEGAPKAIDTGFVNGIPFFNAMGLGFDAEISSRFNRLTNRGLPAYIRTTLSTLFSFRSQSYIIRNGTQRVDTRAFIISIANSDQYGNDCFIAPGAEVDDGHLNLTVVKKVDVFNAVPLTIRLFTKSIDGSPSVTRLRGSHFTIERPKRGLVHTDGETHETGRHIEIEVRPRSLRIMVPKTFAAARDDLVTSKRHR
ncbi:MAG TPA: diacylglycerol kinase family protein [Opitutaceae bacterium]|nr:diacylglycerol kinase family protein [Opitutaceae bacterium]